MLDVLIVRTTEPWKLERTRTAIRNFVAHKLKRGDNEKDAALVAFVSPTERQWRFSYVKMEYAAVETESGKVGVETHLTPARRYSYIVGEGESCHTAQSRFLALLQDTENYPTLAQLEEAFSVEAVTKEFFKQYAALFGDIEAALQKLAAKDPVIGREFKAKNVSTVDFAKKLMGQIVFLYFLQKKGWLGVAKGQDWGTGPRDFLRRLVGQASSQSPGVNIFNDVLEPLFYDTLATDRGHEAWCNRFKCRIPFLNGGLFEPLGDYDWRKTDIILPNKLFTNTERTEAGDTGTGVLDVFDRYNFTVNEAEPLEKEVAIDPEMLGKVFENLIEENRRKGLGSFYTPREIVHYMCQESLINYLDTALNSATETVGREKRKQALLGSEKAEQTLLAAPVRRELVPRADLETFVHLGDQISHYEAVETRYAIKMPKSIEQHARLIDEKLADITICDPAVGSGAFPVGMMTEIVRARSALTPYFNDVQERTPYHFKRHAIQNCLYGVDIDPGAVEIAKLRLWLSLVVDEEDVKQIKPLPNLFYKIVTGNSLLGVEKTLFNQQQFRRLEELKPRYFDEPDQEKKHRYKGQIEEIIHELTNGKEDFDFEIYFSEVFHRTGGFDVVIGNPPYITLALGRNRNVLSKEQVRQYRELYPAFTEYKGNTFSMFIGKSAAILSKGGVLSFIVPNTLLLANTMQQLRLFILKNFLIDELVNIRDRVFEEAETGGNLVFRFTLRTSGNHVCKVVDLGALADLTTAKRQLIKQSVFGETTDCRFSVDDSNSGLLRRMATNAKPLGQVADFYNGIKTGDNKRFLSDRKLNAKYKEVIRGRDVQKYLIEYGNNFVLFDPEQLWSNTNEVKLRKNPKIVIRQTGDSLTAALDEHGYLTLDTTHLIFDTAVPIKALLAILNSRPMNWFYQRLVEEAGRAFAEVKIVNLKKLPIPATAFDTSRQKPLVGLVDRILAAKARDAAADTSALEREIDELVYALYGLTKEEQALAQAAAK